ncbi:MAG: FG-GAP-like repeat-containing protein [Bacteroidota bacterium]
MNVHQTLSGINRWCWVTLCCLLVSSSRLMAETPTPKPYKILSPQDVIRIHSINYGPLFTQTSFNNRTINVSKPVGITKGAHEVSMSGGATYAIPLITPPGTRNMVPNLSMMYSSQAGNGPLGRGWSLGGLSLISRKGNDLYRDGQVKQVLFDNYDHFTLDGNVLIPTSGANGHNNTVYRTENETFMKVVSKGTAGNGPDWFEVTTREGVKMEYGKTGSSQRNVQGGATGMIWFINKVSDQYGNYIEFIYDYNYTDTRIKEIKYTGNSAAGISPYNTIKFFWDLRDDDNRTYQWGSFTVMRHLLEKIEVRSEGNQLMKKYEFEYGFDNLYSYLTSVTESGSAGSSLNATIFKYGDDPTPFQDIMSNHTQWPDVDNFTGDFNGDGHTDFLSAGHTTLNGFKYHTFFRLHRKVPGSNSFISNFNTYLPANQYEVIDDVQVPHFQSFVATDFNGNGQDDILLINKAYDGTYTRMEEIKVYYPNANLSAYTQSTYPTSTPYNIIYPGGNYFFPGDFDGDGRGDYVTVLSNGTGYKVFYSSPSTGTANEEVNVQGAPNPNYPGSIFATAQFVAPLDFNGDGKQDIMVTDWGWTKIYTFYEDGSGNWQAQQIYGGSYPVQTGNGNPGNEIFIGDFNGDGKSDVLTRTGTNNWDYQVGFSDGKVFHQESFPVAYGMDPTSPAHHIRIADVNGDQKSDVVLVVDASSGSDQVHVYYGKGQSANNDFYHDSFSFTNASSIERVVVGDFDGDGRQDVGLGGPNNTKFNMLYFDKEGTDHLLHKVANGFNHVTEFSYETMTKGGSFYTQGSSSTYPVYDLQVGLHLVSEVKVPDGLNGYNTTSYSYEEARMHGQGQGFLGFKKVHAENNVSGVKITSEFELNNTYYVPQLKKQTRRLISGNSLISEDNFNNSIYHFGNKRIWPRVSSQTTTDHLANTNRVMSYAYDTHGNITQSTENINGGLEINISQLSYTANGTWLPAILWKTELTKFRSGASAVHQKHTQYFNSKGAKIKDIKFYGEPQAQTTEYALDAQTGVITQEMKSGSGVINRWTNFTYDAKDRFVIQVGRPYGHVSTRIYDPMWGLPTSMTSADGQTTLTAFDEFGNNISTTDPLGNVSQTSLHWDINTGNGSSVTSPDNSIYYAHTQTTGQPESKVWYTILGQERFKQHRSFNNQWIKNSVTYDSRGNEHKISEPFFSGTPLVSVKSYDAYNRLTQISNTAGNTLYAYSYAGGNLSIQNTKPSGQTSWQTKDPAGKIISSQDNGGILDFLYDSHGNQREVKLNGLKIFEASFDVYNRQVEADDKNAGLMTYAYNTYGEMISQTDANGNQTSLSYDMLGRVLTRVQPEGTVTHQYIPDGSAGEGKLKKITHYDGNISEYVYNSNAQLTTQKERIDGTWFNTHFSYTGTGQQNTITYPSGLVIKRNYNVRGYLTSVKNQTSNVTLFTASQFNQYGQPTSYSLGNGITTQKTYNSYGLLTKIKAGSVQDLNFGVNVQTGNMTYRHDWLTGRFESFQYDNLNRLTRSHVSGQTAINLTYQANGNVATKTGIGSFSYHSQKINALTKVCDASGPIPHAQQDVSYNTYMQPDDVSESNYDIDFQYGGDGQRRLYELTDQGSLVTKRYYVGNFERDITSGTTRDIHYVQATDGLAAMVVKQGGSYSHYYVYKDHLGSILRLTNGSGTVVAEQNFDAWGRKRNASTWNYSNPGTTPDWLYRGYTGHEHMDEVGLINMNGRMYDPILGRMLSPDNFVQSPRFTQSYNRYSYAFNNPLSYTDPSGEFFVIDSWLVGFISGLINGAPGNRWNNAWNEANLRAGNDLRIWGGLFASDPNRNFFGRAWEIISRFTWQSIQTTGGFLTAHAYNTFGLGGGVRRVDYQNGATVLTTGNRWGGIALGSFIIGDNTMVADPNNPLFQHEYGHYLQSQEMGPAYFARIGIPSVISASTDPGNHDWHPVEQDANRRAFLYFNERIPGFQDDADLSSDFARLNLGWDFDRNPLNVDGSNTIGQYVDFRNPADVMMLDRLIVRATVADYAAIFLLGPVKGTILMGLINTIIFG